MRKICHIMVGPPGVNKDTGFVNTRHKATTMGSAGGCDSIISHHKTYTLFKKTYHVHVDMNGYKLLLFHTYNAN